MDGSSKGKQDEKQGSSVLKKISKSLVNEGQESSDDTRQSLKREQSDEKLQMILGKRLKKTQKKKRKAQNRKKLQKCKMIPLGKLKNYPLKERVAVLPEATGKKVVLKE